MTRPATWTALLLAISAVSASAAPVASLRWDSCDPGAPRNKQFAGPGTFLQVVSGRGFEGAARGASIEIEVRGAAGIPDAWRFDNAGCNSGSASFAITAVGKSCPALGSGSIVTADYTYDPARGSARVRIASLLSPGAALNPATTYVLGKVLYDHSVSVSGAGDPEHCGGAEQPLCYELTNASWVDQDGNARSIVLDNATLTWQDPLQTNACIASIFGGARIDEFLPTCAIADTTAQFIELRSSADLDRYSSDLRLRIEDHDLVVRYDAGNLFGAALEGQFWPSGRAWLLATVGSGLGADARIPGVLDPEGGRLTLYDGRPGGMTLQSATYGPATPGTSLVRQGDGSFSASATPQPENSAGPLPGPFECPARNEQVVIREFATACIDGSIAGRFIELEATSNQLFHNSMRLIVRDRNGATVFSMNNLFPGQAETAPWAAGRSWLLGPSTLTGVTPDRFVGTQIDSVKGSVELYGGPIGSTLVDRIDYGPGGAVAAPPHGYSVERQPGALLAVDNSPSPRNFGGASGAGSTCYCPGPECATESLANLRIDEVALRCANGETTAQFVELRAVGDGQEFNSATRLRARDHEGAILFDIGALFPGQGEGAAWSNGSTWLLAAGALARTELLEASGIQPDAFLPGTLDPAGGSIVLYDSRIGGSTLHSVDYGPGTINAAPGRGEALQRSAADTMVIVAQQEPANHAGARARVTQCPCGVSGLQLASGPYVYSTRAVRDTSNIKSSAGYDLRAGWAHVSISDTFQNGCGARISDVYTVLGPTPGEAVNLVAQLHVVGFALGNCGTVHCSSGSGDLALLWNGTRASSRLGARQDAVLSLPLSVRVGEPWHLDWILEAYANSEGPMASAYYSAQLAFGGVPQGRAVTSCSGFRFDAPTATLPALATARSDAAGVHLEWHVPRARIDAAVERTGEPESWEFLGVPVLRGDQILSFDDPTARAGGRYGYRLTWREGPDALSTDIAWVDVPAGALALRALSANPSPGAPVLEYTLPEPGPVRIELTDLRGRRVWARDLGTQSAGPHRLEPGGEWKLAPGIYWARLVRPGGQASLKLVVLGR